MNEKQTGSNSAEAWWSIPQRADAVYGLERFPIKPERMFYAQDALMGLYDRLGPPLRDSGYPWRLVPGSATGLPVFLRVFAQYDLFDALEADDTGNDAARELLLAQRLPEALFGAPFSRSDFTQSFQARPLVRLDYQPVERRDGVPDFAPGPNRSRHFRWQQFYEALPVMGGSLALHVTRGNQRCSVTSSFLPVEDAPPPAGNDGAALSDLALWRAAQACFRTAPPEEKPQFMALMWNLFKRTRPESEIDLFYETVRQLLDLEAGDSTVIAQLQSWQEGPLPPVERVTILDEYPAGILPYRGSYRLVARYSFGPVDERQEPWFVHIDVNTDEVVGEPWQAVVEARYYETSSQAVNGAQAPADAAGIQPQGLQDFIELRDGLATVVALGAVDPLAGNLSPEAATSAVHGLRTLQRLQTVCGMSLVAPASKVVVTAKSPRKTGFNYGSTVKRLDFRDDNGQGTVEGPNGEQVFGPGRDPEVVIHEFVHVFMWLANREPWDAFDSLTPFGRALLEGYAMYLSRSIAARTPTEANQIWARAAYPDVLPGGRSNWQNRWAFGRKGQVPGADLLPGPNMYPAGAYTSQTLQAYDVGMVWARALWDLRQVIGADLADRLAVSAYAYLHGWTVNFELAAEGLIDAASQIGGLDLLDSTQPIWAGRGIVAGQGIHGFAARAGGGLIAAGDEGVLLSPDGLTWSLDATLSPPGQPLTGVLAVAADGNVLYAAAVIPTPAQTRAQVTWRPGVYSRPEGGAPWAPVATALPADATPLSLLVRSPGVLVIGTTRGPYEWRSAAGTLTAPPSLLDLEPVIDMAAFSGGLVACSPSRVFWSAPPNPNWNFAPVGLLGNGNARITALAGAGGNQYFVGTLDALRRVDATGAATRLAQEPVFDLNLQGNNLCIATNTTVRLFDLQHNVFASTIALPPDVTVLSVFRLPGGAILAGTAAHGILTNNVAGGWRSLYPPPTPTSLTLREGACGLALVQFKVANAACRISLPQGIQLLSVSQPGFSLEVVSPAPGGAYNLAAGPVILALCNTRNTTANLMLNVSASGDNIDITG
jgi:hypothetical protein